MVEDPRRSATRRRILDAALALFTKYGFRRTSVDEIAAHAQVAKPTLYAHFDDKDALYRHVCEDVLERLLDDARAAATPTADVTAQLTAVLSAKFTRIFELVHSSPHAQELLDASSRLAGPSVESTDRSYNALLRELINKAEKHGDIDLSRAKLTAPKLVDVLLRCGHGAAYGATTAAEHRKHLAELVRVVVASVKHD
ncbi:MAG: TetR/AcrR family transcriptional regulator [Polyangiaceae bacterium]